MSDARAVLTTLNEKMEAAWAMADPADAANLLRSVVVEAIHALAAEIARREAADDMRTMGHADLAALTHRAYALAAYILRDLATTRRAGLYDLCAALSADGCPSPGDWEGLRELWWKAALDLTSQEKP